MLIVTAAAAAATAAVLMLRIVWASFYEGHTRQVKLVVFRLTV